MKQNRGFTLLEVLLAIAVLAIVSFGSYAGFQGFSVRQNLNITGDTFRNSLNEAKSKAMSQVIATSVCKQAGRTLVGYQISFDTSTDPNQYYIQEVCMAGTVTYTSIVKTIALPPKITFDSPPTAPVRFLIFPGGVNAPATITIKSGTQTRVIRVDASGVIK